MKCLDIERVVTDFTSQADPLHRFASFDYCFNHFSEKENITRDIEKSCLMLGFYLASWGMFRGSSFLLQKSVKVFEPVVTFISKQDESLWSIDVDSYTEENIQRIRDIYAAVKDQLIEDGNADLVLVTKVLLGVFGFVPAFDRYFGITFRALSSGRCGFRRVDENSLNFIKEFYEANRNVIDRLSEKTYTLDLTTGLKTDRNYPKAKIIDMYGFQKSQPSSRAAKAIF